MTGARDQGRRAERQGGCPIPARRVTLARFQRDEPARGTELCGTYRIAVNAWLAMAGLMRVQLSVADVCGIHRRPAPVALVPFEPASPLFRALRMVGNRNESVAIFVLRTLACVGRGADRTASGAAARSFVGSHAGHTACSWAGVGLARSLCFAGAPFALFDVALWTTGA